jgi:long-chain-fatty-acid--[acyl-carrier-protein] ligase
VKSFVEWFLRWVTKIALWFRYRIKTKGLEKITRENLDKPGGVLFLPNHPAMGVEPMSVVQAIWKRFPVRPIVIEYMYYAPVVHSLMKYINAIPIPNNEVSSNSLKRIRSDKALEEAAKGLKEGDNFIIYPSGRLKDTGYEFIGGASGAHRIISQNPECNIVLVRSIGFWGSSFSKAYTGKSPPLFGTMWQGVKHTFKNLLFFNPRRDITIEFEIAPDDFPRYGERLEINRWLEEWYNRPEGLRDPDSDVIGEPLKRVSYSMWKEEYLEPKPPKVEEEDDPEINLDKIPEETKKKVIDKIAEVANVPPHEIKTSHIIASDLSIDSLDMAEIVLFLDDEFDVKGVPVIELTTVGRTMAIAAKQIVVTEDEVEIKDLSPWKKPVKEERKLHVAPGSTIPEVFLNNCAIMGHEICCGDDRSGVMDFQRVKLGVVILADYIKDLPGDNIGIMLPASVGATLTLLACQLAGKVPVMMNWTLGPRHLGSIMEQAEIKRVLSSWAFIDRLGNIDLGSIDDEVVMLEDVKRSISLFQKIKGALISKKSTKSLLKRFKIDSLKEDDTAVILFTSGTESAPKGVPLSHKNLLSNIRSIEKTVDIFSTDIFFSVLPPFHSFGLTAGCLLGTLTGMRVCYYPNPTNGQGLAKGCEKWRPTVICGAPTFLKNMLKAGEPDNFKTLRWVVSGAEAAPKELYDLMEEAGNKDVLKEGYGVTECSPVLTVNRLEVEPKGVGQPLEDVEIMIVHPETHEKLPMGEEGLIIAKGPNVFSGYLNKVSKDPFVKVDGANWYNTGDLGYLDELNRLTITGRLKRFLKIGGEMVSLGAIESALYAQSSKQGWKLGDEGPSLAVVGKEQEEGKPKIVVVATFDATVDQINKALRDEGLSQIVKVTDFKQLDEIPLMGTGKIFYRELEDKYL